MKKIHKLFQTKASSIDEHKKSVRFQISDDKPDRMGEIVDQDSWDLKSYKANPIVLWGHDPSEPENVIGSATVSVEKGKSFADITFAAEINAKAAMVFEMVKAGILRCVSVGFIPHSVEYKDSNDKSLDNPILKDNELLEISVVPIPANPRAVALALKAGSISADDARWMQKSMASEIEHITSQLETEEVSTKDLASLEDKVSKLTDLVGGLGENVTKLQATVTELVDNTGKPTTGQASTQDSDDNDDDDQDDESKDEGSAKDGDDDQSGAEDDVDDLDLDAKLTPEQEAELSEDPADSSDQSN